MENSVRSGKGAESRDGQRLASIALSRQSTASPASHSISYSSPPLIPRALVRSLLRLLSFVRLRHLPTLLANSLHLMLSSLCRLCSCCSSR